MERIKTFTKGISSILAIIALATCIFVICWQQNSINKLQNEVYTLDEAIDYNTSRMEDLNVKMDDQEADRIDGYRTSKEFRAKQSFIKK